MSTARLTPQERRQRARIAGLTSWANTPDRSARAARAHDTRRARLAKQIDPEGRMAPDQLADAVDARIKADMARLSLASSKARRRRRGEAVAVPEQQIRASRSAHSAKNTGPARSSSETPS